MSDHYYNSLKVGVSRHQRMSSQIKYSGADEKIIQAMTSRGNKCMGLLIHIPEKMG